MVNAVTSANFCAEGKRYERVDKFYEGRLVQKIFFLTVEQIHQDNRSIRRLEQGSQLIKFFVERGQVVELCIRVENAPLEKFRIAEHVAQASFGVIKVIPIKFLERVVNIFAA